MRTDNRHASFFMLYIIDWSNTSTHCSSANLRSLQSDWYRNQVKVIGVYSVVIELSFHIMKYLLIRERDFRITHRQPALYLASFKQMDFDAHMALYAYIHLTYRYISVGTCLWLQYMTFFNSLFISHKCFFELNFVNWQWR